MRCHHCGKELKYKVHSAQEVAQAQIDMYHGTADEKHKAKMLLAEHQRADHEITREGDRYNLKCRKCGRTSRINTH